MVNYKQNGEDGDIDGGSEDAHWERCKSERVPGARHADCPGSSTAVQLHTNIDLPVLLLFVQEQEVVEKEVEVVATIEPL